MTVEELKNQVGRLSGQRDALYLNLNRVKEDLVRLHKQELVLVQVLELFRHMIDKEVVEGVKAVEKLLTEGCQTVFQDQDLKVKAQVEVNHGKVSVDLITEQNSEGVLVEGYSNEDFGGAVATVQSILLRLFIILKRNLHPVLLLDESLPAFDDNYVVNMGNFLSLLCKDLGVDILLVTHNPVLVETADKAYRIVKKDNSAQFELVKR